MQRRLIHITTRSATHAPVMLLGPLVESFEPRLEPCGPTGPAMQQIPLSRGAQPHPLENG